MLCYVEVTVGVPREPSEWEVTVNVKVKVKVKVKVQVQVQVPHGIIK